MKIIWSHRPPKRSQQLSVFPIPHFENCCYGELHVLQEQNKTQKPEAQISCFPFRLCENDVWKFGDQMSIMGEWGAVRTNPKPRRYCRAQDTESPGLCNVCKRPGMLGAGESTASALKKAEKEPLLWFHVSCLNQQSGTYTDWVHQKTNYGALFFPS